MQIAGIQKLTLLDFPGRCAATIFTPGCNLRCPFCHNPALVEEDGNAVKSDGSNLNGLLPEDYVLDFLKGRFGRLTGLAVTGGEPLMQDGIEDFFVKVKALGYGIKLDTNGTYPDRLESVISKGLVDYVAMDVKNSWKSYPETIGIGAKACTQNNAAGRGNGEADRRNGETAEGIDPATETILKKIGQSMDVLRRAKTAAKGNLSFNESGFEAISPDFDFEFRSTIVKELHTAADIEAMAKAVGPAEHYFLQVFKDSGDILRSGYSAWDDYTMKQYLEIAKKYSPGALLRGID